MVDQTAHVYPMVGPGMGYKDMITGKWIPSREKPTGGGDGGSEPGATVPDVLGLASATGPEWTARALAQLDEVLIDHAHCEKKAASTAVSLLFKYPERGGAARAARGARPGGARALRGRARAARGARRGLPAPDAEPVCGRAARRRAAGRARALVDTLLCAALIEARSCERMQLLADALGASPLGELYARPLGGGGAAPPALCRARRGARPGAGGTSPSGRARRARGGGARGDAAPAPPRLSAPPPSAGAEAPAPPRGEADFRGRLASEASSCSIPHHA